MNKRAHATWLESYDPGLNLTYSTLLHVFPLSSSSSIILTALLSNKGKNANKTSILKRGLLRVKTECFALILYEGSTQKLETHAVWCINNFILSNLLKALWILVKL